MASENTKSDDDRPETFKEQLDRVAVESRESAQEQRPNPVVEKSKSAVKQIHKYSAYSLLHTRV